MNKLKYGLLALVLSSGLTTASAQDYPCTGWDAYTKGVAEARKTYARYSDYLHTRKDYENAFALWEELFAEVTNPAKLEGQLYLDGAALYRNKIDQATDPEEKKAFLAKMLDLYKGYEACTNGGTAIHKAYKAYYMYSYQADVNQTLATIKEAFKMGGDHTSYFIFGSYSRLAVYLFQNKQLNKEEMRAIYAQMKEVTDKSIAANYQKEQYEAAWTDVEAVFASVESEIFDCAFFVDKYQAQFERLKDDPTTRQNIITALNGKCEETEPFYAQVLEREAVYQDSVFRAKQDSILANGSTWDIIKMYNKLGDKEKEAVYKEKAVLAGVELNAIEKQLPEAEQNEIRTKRRDILADWAYRIADDYYRQRSYGTARKFARRAGTLRANWGLPHMLIGTMYASSGPLCGPGTGLKSQATAWFAIDEWNRALGKNLSDAERQKVRSRIAKYKGFFPSASDLFKAGIEEGSTYTIPGGCWMSGMSTTVRAK